MAKLNVALVGLGFGNAFAPIYRDHPDVGEVTLCDTDKAQLLRASRELGIPRVRESLDEVLADPTIDAVHLVTPIPLHAEQSARVLEAGKHCACTVPMATSLDGIRRVADARRASGKRYMMMETTLYTYQMLYARAMLERGELGRIQFLRGSHYQAMENWPDYWMGLPPMHYATHAVAPLVSLAGAPAKRVVCFGSGTMDASLCARYGNPYPVESALIEFENGMKAEATRALFETARTYQEGLFVYGSEACFEWGFRDGDAPVVTRMLPAVPGKRGRECAIETVELPNFPDGLPEPIRRYTVGGNFDPLNPQKSLVKGAGGGHHGSHPHLVHEFVRAVIEDREPAIGVPLAANITAVGVCAHESAMRGGASVEIPSVT